MIESDRTEEQLQSLILHAMGAASAETSADIEQRLADDPGLRLELELVEAFLGESQPTEWDDAFGVQEADSPERHPSPRIKALGARRHSNTHVILRPSLLAAGFLSIAVLGSMGWAARQPEVLKLKAAAQQSEQVLAEQQAEIKRLDQLVKEADDEGWFDAGLWAAPPEWIESGGVKAERGFTRLVNRGYLVTRHEVQCPVELSFDWKWVQLGLKPPYSDFLTVVVRTTGEPERKHPYEIHDGVAVRFIAWDGSVSIWNLGMKEPIDPKTATGSFPMPADAWHHIRITDDGENVAVYLDGPAIKPEWKEKAILEARILGDFRGQRISICNRESIGGIPHESFVRKVSIAAAQPRGKN